MTVRYYESSDVAAPIVTGEQDTFNNLLYNCLVTGYGTRTAAGWTREYDNGNISVFRSGAGNQFYLQVNDGLVGNENFARVQGFETMSSYDTGTGEFPTFAQVNDGYVFKSSTKNTTIRDWFVLATESIVYVFINTDGSSGFQSSNFFVFGDIFSYAAIDDYASFILVETDVLNSNSSQKNSRLYNDVNTATTGHYVSRSFTQVGGSIQVSKFYDSSKDLMNYPNPVDGGLYVSKIFIGEPINGNLRGHLPGMYKILHDGINFNNGDTFDGTGPLTGKSFRIIKTYNNLPLALEISDTW